MFTRLLVGLDESPQSDAALEQAVVLARRFRSVIVVAVVVEEDDEPAAAAVLLERARFRVEAAGLDVEAVQREGPADVNLAELAKEVDAALVGRRGLRTERSGPSALGRTAASLIRLAEQTVIVCGGVASGMRSCAVAFDGSNRRALDLAGRFASVTGATVHVVHAYRDREKGIQVTGQAEAELSLLGVQFQVHLEEGSAAEVIARVVRAIRADALFAGAHVPRGLGEPRPSVASHTEEILLHTDLPVAIQP